MLDSAVFENSISFEDSMAQLEAQEYIKKTLNNAAQSDKCWGMSYPQLLEHLENGGE